MSDELVDFWCKNLPVQAVILTNSVILSVLLVLILSMVRVNVVIALTASALIGGMVDGFSFEKALEIFSNGLGDGAKIALSYAMLGAFAAAVAHSGISVMLADRIILSIKNASARDSECTKFKIIILVAIGLMSILSKNVIPVHIAFIPILIPPLLGVFSKLKIDRRLVACIITFGLVVAYMVVPYGVGHIFLNNILLHNLNLNGMEASMKELMLGMIFPTIGMVIGLISSCLMYHKPREYNAINDDRCKLNEKEGSFKNILVSIIAIIISLAIQLKTKSTIASALGGFLVFSVGGVVHWMDSDNVVTQGFKMMAMMAFIMIAAAGYSAVIRSTGDIGELVNWLASGSTGGKAMVSFGMLMIGLLITMGIGSSFSTVPIITSIYVPLCMKLGFSTLATITIVASASITGDAGAPVSDTMLGATSGLGADGQHDHIWDTTIPAFIHFNFPVIILGWIGSLVL
ncbi:MAG: hypothetical protein LBH49_01215 [Puniceicoccales bacterium]|jgi:predicted histidine transporter YuiF (NhaC family)|nr:hypothetical protein [Puniceicoccales bacterium]